MRFDCADEQFRVIRDSISGLGVICVMSTLRYKQVSFGNIVVLASSAFLFSPVF